MAPGKLAEVLDRKFGKGAYDVEVRLVETFSCHFYLGVHGLRAIVGTAPGEDDASVSLLTTYLPCV